MRERRRPKAPGWTICEGEFGPWRNLLGPGKCPCVGVKGRVTWDTVAILLKDGTVPGSCGRGDSHAQALRVVSVPEARSAVASRTSPSIGPVAGDEGSESLAVFGGSFDCLICGSAGLGPGTTELVATLLRMMRLKTSTELTAA